MTYDPATSGAVTINSFSSAVLGRYLPVTGSFSGPGAGGIDFGNNCSGGFCGVDNGQSQFVILFSVGAGGAVTDDGVLFYAVSGTPGIFSDSTQTVTQVVPTAVPEPSALALLGVPAALLALGAGRRGRGRGAAA